MLFFPWSILISFREEILNPAPGNILTHLSQNTWYHATQREWKRLPVSQAVIVQEVNTGLSEDEGIVGEC